MEFTATNSVQIQQPDGSVAPVPLLFDSPHSGNQYPDSYNYVIPLIRLRRAEDAFVDQLFSEVPNYGAVLIDAKFPRSYLDPNRNELDFSPDDLVDEYPIKLNPGEKAKNGTGLVWVRMHGLTNVYDHKFAAAELQRRIETCWLPYHTAVSETLDHLHREYGYAYHLNCHSMRSVGNIKDPDGPIARPDFVLSDRDGTTCEPGFTKVAQEYLQDLGFTVQVNFPMKGVELVRRYSDPFAHRHSLQIEINRRFYMDETAIEKRFCFNDFKRNITGLIAALADYTKAKGDIG